MRGVFRQHCRGAAYGLLAWAVLLLGAAGDPSAQTRIASDLGKHAGELLVPLHKSQVLRVDVPFTELLIGNPEIADVLALSDRSLYLLGKTLGATSLTIYGRGKRLIAVVDVVVGPDVEGLKSKLFELLPRESVEVRAVNGAVALGGTVSSAPQLSKVLAIAERFAPDAVTNLMSVRGSQQVMLKVRFVEVSRTALKRLGVNLDLFDGDFSFTSGDAFLGVGAVAQGDAFAAALASGNIGALGLRLLFEALETKGMAKTLAEPNLIALSGDTASFLAGGEFPIEVAQSGAGVAGDAAITIEFKEFGISLSFTPTVLDDGLINLVVRPEVSALDFSVAVNGTPGLTTRRATTTVELRDGQAFAIAGLLQEDFQDTVRQVPLLGDLPVLGALFRSSAYQRNESELVIIVEPHLVRPVAAGTLATPADRLVPPSDIDLFLHGRIEGRAPGPAQTSAAAPAPLLFGNDGGGLQGSHGHVLR